MGGAVVGGRFSIDLSCVCAGCKQPFADLERARGGHRLSITVQEDGSKVHLVQVSKPCPLCMSFRVEVRLAIG